ncbi:unnamed protein product [Calypogeia fissa]
MYTLRWQDPHAPANPWLEKEVSDLEDFLEWWKVVTECHEDLNPAVPLEEILMCAAYSYIDDEMKRKRFQVYTHLAWVCGYAEQTKLPACVEAAIKHEWHDEGE